jgi:FkbM family methyltransferase
MEKSPRLEGIFFKDLPNSYLANILKEIYIDRVYAPFLEGRKDLIIADWGANIGVTSFFFKDFAKQIYAVEPSARHIECIQQMIDFNQIKNIKICPYAISNENGTEKFYHPENVTMYSMENVMESKEFEEVEAVTPLAFIGREGIKHIDLLKFDCEGSESKIVASNEFAHLAKITDVICGEWHSWTSMSQPQFKQAFEDLGFDFNWLATEAQCFTAVKRK